MSTNFMGQPGLVVGGGSGSGGGDDWTNWRLPPANPNPLNDEFTEAQLNARWTPVVQGTWTAASYGPVDSAGVPTSATAIKLTPNYKNSWLALQGDGGIIRTFTLTLPLQFRFRCSIPSNNAQGGAFGNLYCGESIAGVPDMTNNYARFGWTNLASNQPIILATGRMAGGGGFDAAGPNAYTQFKDLELILVLTNQGGAAAATWYVRDGTSSPTILQGPTSVGGSGNFAPGRSAYVYWRSNCRWDEQSVAAPTKWSAITTLDYLRVYNSTDLSY